MKKRAACYYMSKSPKIFQTKNIGAKYQQSTATRVIVHDGKPYLKPRQYAQKHDVSYPTVLKWLQKRLLQGVRKEPSPPPFLTHIYLIPADAKTPELRRRLKLRSKEADKN